MSGRPPCDAAAVFALIMGALAGAAVACNNPSFRHCEAGVELPALGCVGRRLTAAGGRLRVLGDVGRRGVASGTVGVAGLCAGVRRSESSRHGQEER